MQRIVVMAACAALGLVMFEAAPAAANEVQTKATEISAQTRKKPRTTLTVRPRSYPYPYRSYSSPYPLPYAADYPGPNAVRQCAAHMVQEFRPSGTVIVPRVRCWWARG